MRLIIGRSIAPVLMLALFVGQALAAPQASAPRKTTIVSAEIVNPTLKSGTDDAVPATVTLAFKAAMNDPKDRLNNLGDDDGSGLICPVMDSKMGEKSREFVGSRKFVTAETVKMLLDSTGKQWVWGGVESDTIAFPWVAIADGDVVRLYFGSALETAEQMAKTLQTKVSHGGAELPPGATLVNTEAFVRGLAFNQTIVCDRSQTPAKGGKG